MKKTKHIDVAKSIKKKSLLLYFFLSIFFLKWIRKTVHEDDMNDIINKYQDLDGIEFNNAIIKEFDVKIRVINEEKIPKDGRYIFVSNHPLGGFDGMALLKTLNKHHPKLKFVVNDLLLNFKNFKSLFVPVNKHGKQSKKNATEIKDIFNSEAQVLYFPAGKCSRKIDGKIVDLKWQKNFIKKAIEHKRNIVPIFIKAKNSNWFYSLSNFRKKLGLPNIEMFYLADEIFKQKGKTITLIVGDAFSWSDIKESKDPPTWVQKIRNYLYSLSAQESGAFFLNLI